MGSLESMITQAAQAAHARRFKPLKLTRPTTSMKERVEPEWRRLLKEDRVRFMLLSKLESPRWRLGGPYTSPAWHRARCTTLHQHTATAG